jgi:hypothetical protein
MKPFDDLFGILVASHSVSLEEMEQALSQQGQDGFDDVKVLHTFDRKLSRLHGAKLVEGEL